MKRPDITLTTLVTGGSVALRETAIAQDIDRNTITAIILEGLHDGTSPLHSSAIDFPLLTLARIAPGCLCCSGNLTMRVTLNRMLRRPPARLYLSLASSAHLAAIRSFLTQDPYNKLLLLTKDIQV